MCKILRLRSEDEGRSRWWVGRFPGATLRLCVGCVEATSRRGCTGRLRDEQLAFESALDRLEFKKKEGIRERSGIKAVSPQVLGCWLSPFPSSGERAAFLAWTPTRASAAWAVRWWYLGRLAEGRESTHDTIPSAARRRCRKPPKTQDGERPGCNKRETEELPAGRKAAGVSLPIRRSSEAGWQGEGKGREGGRRTKAGRALGKY